MVRGRFRLLAAAQAPREIDAEELFEDLVQHVNRVAPDLLPGSAAWRSWARLEAYTSAPPAAVCAGASQHELDALANGFRSAGWEVTGKLVAGRADPLTATAACLDRRVRAVAIHAAPAKTGAERRLSDLAAALEAAVSRRGDVTLLRVREPIRTAAAELRERLEPQGDGRRPDGRMGQVAATVSLATLLARPIDLVDVGASAGAYVHAGGGGEASFFVDPNAALVPESAMNVDGGTDGIVRWSSLRSDARVLADRVRNLRLHPWQDSSAEGGRLRLAALRAALSRLARGREAARPGHNGRAPGTDLLLASGGAFAAIPAAVAGLALVDAFRRPGAMSMLWDHARLLGPIGTLEAERDRRRLLSDLLDDAFLPLGSALVVSGLRHGSASASLRITTRLSTSQTELGAGALRVLDLPPGVSAQVELDSRTPISVGASGRRVAMTVAGGIGGLLVDTREVPLRLPESAEQRRALLEDWERLHWPAREAAA